MDSMKRAPFGRLLFASLSLLFMIAAPANAQGRGPSAAIRATATPASEHVSTLPSLKGLRPMDGIDIARYDGFWNDWKLVSVRYRKDNGEQRFIYANPVAWESMRK